MSNVTALPSRVEERCRDLDPVATIARINHYREKPPENSRVFHVTEEVARAALEFNKNNRPPKKVGIKRFKADMLASAFHLLGDTIKFGASGLLLDGQNRLMAVVEAAENLAAEGKSFDGIYTHIVFGIDDLLFAFMDRGKLRSGSDAFAIAKFSDTTVTAQTVRWCKLFAEGRITDRTTYEPVELLDWVNKRGNKKVIKDAVSTATKIYRDTKIHPPGTLAALIVQFREANPAKAELYIAAYANTGGDNLAKKNISELEKKLKKMSRISLGRIHEVPRFAMHILAWNKYVAGKSASPKTFGTFKKKENEGGFTAFPIVEG